MRILPATLVLCASLACAGDRAREADRPYTGGIAQVESVEVEVRPQAPASAWAVVRGRLPDACTQLQTPDVRRTGSIIDVILETRRPFGASCAQMVVPFEKRVRLGIDSEVSGAYVVNVNGVSQSFAVNVRGAAPAF